MKKIQYKTKEEVLLRGREVIGIPLDKIDSTNRIITGKGAVGSIIEESWFGYKTNNKPEADFAEAGVELKVTPFIRTSRGLRAKERLVCNIINYMTEYENTFYNSSFWKKCNTMLLLSYEHKDGLEKGKITIEEATLFSFPVEDLAIIENDWSLIMQKIKNGEAHKISEGDTLYLGACTKGATAATMRQQPFSEELAKQRAYSLKQSYMTYVLNSYIFGEVNDEHIIKDPAILRDYSFEDYILNKVRPYLGRTQVSLQNEFKLETSAKNINALILGRILGLKGKISNTEEFKKANIIPKTIRVNADGSITENMSFPSFNFINLVNEQWDSSELKSMLEQTKFLFVVFRFLADRTLVLEDLMFWNMPESDFDEVKQVWEKTVEVLREGVVFRTSGKRTFNNLPKASENRVLHVRPHAKDSKDRIELPDGRTMPKQCFWLNNTYIREQLEQYWNKQKREG